MSSRVWIGAALCAVTAVTLGGTAGADAKDKTKTKVRPPASRIYVLVEPRDARDMDAIARDAGATVSGAVAGTDFWKVRVGTARTTTDTVAVLSADSRVAAAEEDVGLDVPEGGGSTIPAFGDDPTSSVATQPALARIQAATAHARATGRGVLVAVIDSGVVASHPLLDGRVSSDGWDFVDGDADPTDGGNGLDDNGDGDVDEGVGHGTFVASLVLAAAPGARILPVRALDSDACGTASSVAAAISYAARRGARVINLSLGASQPSAAIRQAVANARVAGAVVLGAAGNDAVAALDYPAAQGESLGVTAVDGSDVHAAFTQYGSAADLCAPGVDLIGAFPGAPSGTARWSGTSFGTALSSGAAALVLEQHPTWVPADVENRLRTTGVSLGTANPTCESWLGVRIDLDAATR